jgi:hypothetical protein
MHLDGCGVGCVFVMPPIIGGWGKSHRGNLSKRAVGIPTARTFYLACPLQAAAFTLREPAPDAKALVLSKGIFEAFHTDVT